MFTEVRDDVLVTPLTAQKGHAEAGRNVFVHRDKGHCVLCHQVANLGIEFQGNIGPDLTAIGSRMTAEQIRLRLVDYERVKPNVLMPSYFKVDGLNQLGEDYKGQTLLSAQDIEDVIAFLTQLKTEADFDTQ